jgi:hypothetical protein
MRGYKYPKCCKIYNINDFEYDNSWHGSNTNKQKNYKREKEKVLKYEKKFGDYYPNVLITAAVTNRQVTAKKVLDDLGYELVQEINNPDYGDGIVYFYKKLLSREPRKKWGE